MKKLLQSKKRSVIEYLPKKELAKLMPLTDFKSVTEVLSDPKKRSFFKKQMNDPNSCMAKAVKQGTKTHKALETGQAKDELIQACLDFFERDILIDVDEIWGQEEWVAHPLAYKGKFDGVGIFRGKLTLFDYKKTNKRKTKSQLKGYFSQLAAYKQAHEHLYQMWPIEQLAIFNIHGTSVDSLGAEAVVLEPSEVAQFTESFNARIKGAGK